MAESTAILHACDKNECTQSECFLCAVEKLRAQKSDCRTTKFKKHTLVLDRLRAAAFQAAAKVYPDASAYMYRARTTPGQEDTLTKYTWTSYQFQCSGVGSNSGIL